MKKLVVLSLMGFIVVGSTLSFNASLSNTCINWNGWAVSYGEVGSNDYYQESMSRLMWNQGGDDTVYAFLRNSDSLNQNTNAEVKLYSRDRDGSYTYQAKAREEGVPYGDMVELRSTKNWYSWDDFKAHYYYTWISNDWWTLYSYAY